MRIAFEYDPRKAESNLKKHGVTFREAMSVFDDALAQSFPDELHSLEELRFVTIGMSNRNRLLFVAHQESGTVVRLIGARQVTTAERKAYEELNQL